MDRVRCIQIRCSLPFITVMMCIYAVLCVCLCTRSRLFCHRCCVCFLKKLTFFLPFCEWNVFTHAYFHTNIQHSQCFSGTHKTPTLSHVQRRVETKHKVKKSKVNGLGRVSHCNYVCVMDLMAFDDRWRHMNTMEIWIALLFFRLFRLIVPNEIASLSPLFWRLCVVYCIFETSRCERQRNGNHAWYID